MLRLDVIAADDLQTRRLDHRQQCIPRAQAEMLSEIRQDQPALAARFEMRGEAVQKASQHAAIRVVDGPFDRRAWPCRKPWRIAHDERRAALGKEIGLDDFDLGLEPEARQVFVGAGARARVLIGADHALHAAFRKNGSEHAGARADVERQCLRRQWRFRDQIDIFAAHR